MENNIENSVDVYIASLWRDGHIIKSIESLIIQTEINTINISCNNYNDKQWKFINDKIKDNRIILNRTNNEKESNEKLKFIDKGNGKYISLCDDDLIYPKTYLNKLINGCEKYNAFVSLHGSILNKRPIKSYYNNRKVFRSLHSLDEDKENIDIISNCGSLFKRSFFNNLDEWYDFCENISMDDIYVSYFCNLNNIKKVVLKHREGYLKHKKQLKSDNYVFDKYKNNENNLIKI